MPGALVSLFVPLPALGIIVLQEIAVPDVADGCNFVAGLRKDIYRVEGFIVTPSFFALSFALVKLVCGIIIYPYSKICNPKCATKK